MTNIFHILVIDDDDRIRDLLNKYLQDHGFYVTAAENANEAYNQIREFIFDLIIVDIMMPGETGTEFTKNLRKKHQTPVLMLTAMGDVEDRIQGLECGADDYLAKPFEPRELLLRITKILDRTRPNKSTNNFVFGNITYSSDKRSLECNNEPISITTNEIYLLSTLCNNIEKVVSREALSAACGGINERSVDVQITRLRNKIEKDPKNPQYLKTIRGEGYILYSN